MVTNWIIEWLRTTPTTATPPAYVVECGWRCNGTEGPYSGTVYGTCSFAQEPDENGDFIPYDRLTQDMVLSWCWGSGVPREDTERNVEQQIENQKNPPYIQPPLPWASTAATPKQPEGPDHAIDPAT